MPKWKDTFGQKYNRKQNQNFEIKHANFFAIHASEGDIISSSLQSTNLQYNKIMPDLILGKKRQEVITTHETEKMPETVQSRLISASGKRKRRMSVISQKRFPKYESTPPKKVQNFKLLLCCSAKAENTLKLASNQVNLCLTRHPSSTNPLETYKSTKRKKLRLRESLCDKQKDSPASMYKNLDTPINKLQALQDFPS